MEDDDFFHAEKSSQVKPSLSIQLGEFDPGLSIAGVFLKERVESLDVLIESSFSLFMSSQLPCNLWGFVFWTRDRSDLPWLRFPFRLASFMYWRKRRWKLRAFKGNVFCRFIWRSVEGISSRWSLALSALLRSGSVTPCLWILLIVKGTLVRVVLLAFYHVVCDTETYVGHVVGAFF